MDKDQIIKILETEYKWNEKSESGFSETQKMIIEDVTKIFNNRTNLLIDKLREARIDENKRWKDWYFLAAKEDFLKRIEELEKK